MSAGITANNDGSADITVGGVSAIEISAAGAVTIPNLSGGVPSGAVFWFAASTAPTGYLKANGAAVSRTTYAALFAVVGTTFGAGDGSTTFNLPNLLGEFIRGWDDGRGVDPGRVFGSAQADEFESHTHGGVPVSAAAAGMVFNPSASYNATAGSTSAAGGAETRPRNVALLPCIKT
jgi:phage-related tail fiber protein